MVEETSRKTREAADIGARIKSADRKSPNAALRKACCAQRLYEATPSRSKNPGKYAYGIIVPPTIAEKIIKEKESTSADPVFLRALQIRQTADEASRQTAAAAEPTANTDPRVTPSRPMKPPAGPATARIAIKKRMSRAWEKEMSKTGSWLPKAIRKGLMPQE